MRRVRAEKEEAEQLKGDCSGTTPRRYHFEAQYSIGEPARQWKLGRETIRLLVKDEPDVLKIRLCRRKAFTLYSMPESVARRVHNRLFNPAA